MVTLRVLVDTRGYPREVIISKGSGHLLLDKTARDHVLKRWRFQPALRGGVAIEAWGVVPIRFSLPD